MKRLSAFTSPIYNFVGRHNTVRCTPALALRVSYQLNQSWIADSFVEKFQPSVLPNPNTPYNIISSQFTIHDLYKKYDSRLNFGVRIKGDIDGVGLQGVLARRYNPDGVYRWTESGVNRDIPGLAGSGGALAHTAFEVDSSGVWSASEWYNYAAQSR